MLINHEMLLVSPKCPEKSWNLKGNTPTVPSLGTLGASARWSVGSVELRLPFGDFMAMRQCDTQIDIFRVSLKMCYAEAISENTEVEIPGRFSVSSWQHGLSTGLEPRRVSNCRRSKRKDCWGWYVRLSYLSFIVRCYWIDYHLWGFLDGTHIYTHIHNIT